MNQSDQVVSSTQSFTPYDQAFFDLLLEGAERSARQIVPIILDWVAPQSVVDVGCGLGAWLSVFQSLGIQDYLGLDGKYIDRSNLRIPPSNFLEQDLTQPFNLNRRFDLAMSLEVAEHLPADSAQAFVESLVLLADIIIFSAAIPFQGGTEHLNEQWPAYWVDLFNQHDYQVVDCLRPRIWNNEQVEPWYIQNSLLFIKTDKIGYFPRIPTSRSDCASFPLEVIHPKIYQSSLTHYIELWRVQIAQAESELQTTQKLLEEAQNKVMTVQSSKYWKLRMRWLHFQEWLAKK